jgi:RNA polymerase sigma-70 factor, ECF subfamily
VVADVGTAGDPADRVTLDESVSMAHLVVLERLSPAERTSFLLHDVFGLPFAEIADVVGRSPAAVRQLGMATVNGAPGLVVVDADGVLSVISFAVDGGRITAIDAVRNPDKLGASGSRADGPDPAGAARQVCSPARIG